MDPRTADLADRPAATSPALLRHETLATYKSQWDAFGRWCSIQGKRALPATPADAAAYLLSLRTKKRANTISQIATSIGYYHRAAGHQDPTKHPDARRARKAETRSTMAKLSTSLSPDAFTDLAMRCPSDIAGLRDKAMLLLLGTGKLSRAEVVSLEAEGVKHTENGTELTLHAKAGDPGGFVRIQNITRNKDIARCPICALEDWMMTSNCRFGAVFRQVTRTGDIDYPKLTQAAVSLIIAKRSKSGTSAKTRRRAKR